LAEACLRPTFDTDDVTQEGAILGRLGVLLKMLVKIHLALFESLQYHCCGKATGRPFKHQTRYVV
jgi:hypothetical protein